MEIKSLKLGTIQVEPQSLYQFPHGLIGMAEHQQFAMIHPDPSMPFAYLQSLDAPEICMLITDPFTFHRDYAFDLSDEDVQQLGQPSLEDVALWVTVSARESLQEATMNLLAPIVLNRQKKQGRQVLLHTSTYKTRVPLFPEPKEGK